MLDIYIQYFRSIWPGDMFGQSSDDDVITLLNMYCTGLAEKKTGENLWYCTKPLLLIEPGHE